jgi:hypothetical protein
MAMQMCDLHTNVLPAGHAAGGLYFFEWGREMKRKWLIKCARQIMILKEMERRTEAWNKGRVGDVRVECMLRGV